MSERRIFTFWEPKGSMPAYLQLCRETWLRNSPGRTLVELNYDNLELYTGLDVLDLDSLKTVRLPAQKDVILFAVLARNGGIFMDMDTIVFGNLSGLERRLSKTGLVMFHVHLGVAAARPGSPIMLECLAGARQRLAGLRQDGRSGADVSWDYFGNSILYQTLWNAARRGNLIARAQGAVLGGLARTLSRTGQSGAKAAAFLQRADQYIATQVIFRHTQQDTFLMLNRDRQGFIAERIHGNRRIRDPQRKYVDYWFGESRRPQWPVPSQSAIIGLHHSWTPAWYTALSEAEVLDHGCLLSRTLRQALGLTAATES